MNAFLTLKRKDLVLIARSLSLRRALDLVRRNLLDINHYYAMEMRLNGSLSKPQTPLTHGQLMRMGDGDIERLKEQLDELGDEDRKDLLGRILFYERGFRNCYAYQINGTVAFLQWIVYPSENEAMRTKYKRRYLPLKEGQVMLENAFTFPRYRGFGLMQFVSVELLKIGKSEGHARAICYVRKENVNSLNNLMQIGFRIRKLVREHKLFGYVWRNW